MISENDHLWIESMSELAGVGQELPTLATLTTTGRVVKQLLRYYIHI